MFFNISPAIYNVSETLCSLTFATRCRNVELVTLKYLQSDFPEYSIFIAFLIVVVVVVVVVVVIFD